MDLITYSQLFKNVFLLKMKALFTTLFIFCLITGSFAQEKKRGGYEFHLSLANGYYDQKEYGKAIESIKDALRTKRNKPHVYVLRAKIHLARNNNPEAISDLERASKMGSEEADKMLVELGLKPYGAMSQKQTEAFENEVEEYLKKIEAQNEPKQKGDKKTKTRK